MSKCKECDGRGRVDSSYAVNVRGHEKGSGDVLTTENCDACEGLGHIAADCELRRGDAGMPVVAYGYENTRPTGERHALMMVKLENVSDQYPELATPLVRQSDAQAALAAQAVEIERLRKDALRASAVAFAMLVSEIPDERPEDARELADWLDTNVLSYIPDDMGPEELFIGIIRAAIAKETTK